jgi:hypothetical protein
MSTDDENERTGGAVDWPTDTPRDEENVQGASEDDENGPPRIRDHPGQADEWFARAIIATPFVLLLVGGVATAVLVWTGQVTLDVTVAGTIPVRPLVLGFAALVGGAYVLAAAKEWGIRPVKWVANAARDYDPDSNSDSNEE